MYYTDDFKTRASLARKRFYANRNLQPTSVPTLNTTTMTETVQRRSLKIIKSGQPCKGKLQGLIAKGRSFVKTVGSGKVPQKISDSRLTVCQSNCEYGYIVEDDDGTNRRTLCPCCRCGDWQVQTLGIGSSMEYKVTKAGASCPHPDGPKWGPWKRPEVNHG